jgi:diadenosine tetraphosphate (Ap4A) HIT family hydrolase
MMVHLRHMSPKLDISTTTCRFCILPEPERIALRTPNFVVLMGLGPIAVGYCIIITRKHYASYAELPNAQLSEFRRVVEAVQETQEKVFGASVLFEHGRNGGCLPHGHDDDLCYHAHMHLLPTTVNLAEAVGEDYQLQILPGWEYLSRTARKNSYLLVQDGDDLNYIVNPQELPPRYLRTKAAEQVLDDATLADWQAFPSYDLIREGKEAIQDKLEVTWQVKWELRQRIFSPGRMQWMKARRPNDEISLMPTSQSVS